MEVIIQTDSIMTNLLNNVIKEAVVFYTTQPSLRALEARNQRS